MREAAEDDEQPSPPTEQRTFVIATGTSAAPLFQPFLHAHTRPQSATVHVEPIVNSFFGETVTVAGLLTAGDVLSQLPSALLLEGADEAADQRLDASP